MASIFPKRATSSPTPQAVWQFNSKVIVLLQKAGRLCRDLAQACLDEESARFKINDVSSRLSDVTSCKELFYWCGRAYATTQPQEGPSNPHLASCHIFCVRLVLDFIQPVLAHQIVKTQPAEPSTIRVPQVLTGAIDLAAVAEIAKQCERFFDKIDEEDVALLRSEADMACKLLAQSPSDQQQQPAPESSTPIFLGTGRYRVGVKVICLGGSQADALQALVELRAATFEQLKKHSGASNPSVLLKSICENQALLAPYISLPGGKNKGGYSTTILDGSKINKATTTD
jgi:hypothetical protein